MAARVPRAMSRITTFKNKVEPFFIGVSYQAAIVCQYIVIA